MTTRRRLRLTSLDERLGATVAGRVLRGGVLAVLMFLGACASEPVPVQTTTPTPAAGSPTSAPAPAPTPVFVTPTAAPVMPEAAKEMTPEGAEAFARYWFDTLNWATHTNDTDLLEFASEEDCKLCGTAIDDAKLRDNSEKRVDGGMINLKSVSFLDQPDDDIYLIEVILEQGESSEMHADGHNSPLWSQTQNERNEVALSPSGQGWLVREVGTSIRCEDCSR